MGKPKARVSKGTISTPPPSPTSEPSIPATIDPAKISKTVSSEKWRCCMLLWLAFAPMVPGRKLLSRRIASTKIVITTKRRSPSNANNGYRNTHDRSSNQQQEAQRDNRLRVQSKQTRPNLVQCLWKAEKPLYRKTSRAQWQHEETEQNDTCAENDSSPEYPADNVCRELFFISGNFLKLLKRTAGSMFLLFHSWNR